MASRSRQASPLSTESTSYPSSRSTPPSALRTPGSSSTIRMDGISTRQFDGEAGPARFVVGDVDAAAVFGNDAPDDGQAQAAAPPLGRIVGKEQLVALGGRDAR